MIGIEVDEASESAITERITLALIEAVANDQLTAGARVVVAYSGFESETLDSITVVRLGEHLEQLGSARPAGAGDLGPVRDPQGGRRRGRGDRSRRREGKTVGTLIVVGDVRNVLSRTRALGFDPFKGYKRKERNLRDPRVREAIKEIAQMDGGFIVARRHRRIRLPHHRRPQLRPDSSQGSRHPPLGRRRHHQRHQRPGRRRQPVHRHRPPLPKGGHPPDRPDAARACHEMARRRDRTRPRPTRKTS